MDQNIIQTIAIAALPVIFAITLHEAAHGYIAMKLGDRTAFMLGRVTMNPIRHIDPIGTILVPLLTFMMGGILFGWAKPVPVNFGNLHHPKKDMLWVAAAGPGANIAMALFWAAVIKLAHVLPLNDYTQPLALMGQAGITINAILAALNLLPLPPLDGGRIAVSLLPPRWAYGLARVEPYGMFILIALLVTGLLNSFMMPIFTVIQRLSYFIFGL